VAFSIDESRQIAELPLRKTAEVCVCAVHTHSVSR
jgi:hypothetical protein